MVVMQWGGKGARVRFGSKEMGARNRARVESKHRAGEVKREKREG